MISVSPDTINASTSMRDFEAQIRERGDVGAVVSFAGLVRDHASSGQVRALTLQAYAPMTQNGIAETVEKARRRWPISNVMIKHRIGTMAPGETIVFVATASAHRRAAFEAADFLMDYLKTEAIFWKQETTQHGAVWIEPRADDYADAARWRER